MTVRRRAAWIDLGALLPLAALLVAVIATVYRRYDGSGFDFDGHVDYLRYIDLSATFPVADRAWEFYHPPAYHLTAVLAFEAAHRLGWAGSLVDAARAVSTTAWVLEGLVAAVAVRLLGGGRVGIAAAAALVWLLPGQYMLGSMVYMETLAGLGEGLLVLGAIAWTRERRWGLVAIGIGFPLAALSKFSGLVAGLVVLAVLAWTARRRLGPVLAAALPGAIPVAAFYGHNTLVFHTPTPLNAELFRLDTWDPLHRWGNPPGFFTRFDQGAAHANLVGGACGAYDSFWAGVWKWLWATDCFPMPFQDQVRGWLLAGAMLATVVVFAALAWIVARAARDPVLVILAAVPAAVFVALVYYVVRVPSGTADKGVYLLNAIVPAAVALGLLVGRLGGRMSLAPAGYLVVLAWAADMAHASGLG